MSAEHPTPWRIEGQTIRDANGYVVVSAINPCNMATRREIVAAVNALLSSACPPTQGDLCHED